MSSIAELVGIDKSNLSPRLPTTGGLESSQAGGLSTSNCAVVGLFFEQFPESQ